MGYYIPKSAVEGFDPDVYFEGPIVDENGLCLDKESREAGWYKNLNMIKEEK